MSKRSQEQIEAMEASGLITPTRASELASVSRSTVYRWIAEEKIKTVVTGSGVYVKRPSLLRHLGPEMCKALGLKDG